MRLRVWEEGSSRRIGICLFVGEWGRRESETLGWVEA